MDQPNVVLPKELRLGAPATMPQSRSYMFKQTAALSNYNPRDTIQINLPRLQRSYLTKDSYLEFEVTFTHKTPATNPENASLTLDTPGAFGLIDRIEVYDYLGSTQLESTAGFGQLVALLQETCVAQDEYATHWEVTTGGHGAQTVYDWERSSQKGNESLTADCKVYRPTQPLIGEVLDRAEWANDANSATTAASQTRTIRRKYHIPLFSFLGLLSPKYAPLHNGYTIMITLNTAANALVSAGARYVFEPPLVAVANSATTAGTASGTTLTIAANTTIKPGWNVFGAGMSALGTVISRPSATSVIVNSQFTPTASTYAFAAPGTATLVANTATTAGGATGTALAIPANTTIQQGWNVFGAGMNSVGTVVGRASGTAVQVDQTFTPTASSYVFTTPLSGPTGTTISTSTDVSFTINNARMCCQILELGPIAESMLLATTGNQPMIVTTKAYRNYTSSFPAQTGTYRLDLNINVASLTNVLWMMRPTLHMNNVAFPTLSHRQRNFLESWYFQYGSSILPQTQGIVAFKPASNDSSHKDFGSEALIELLKARHMYNQPSHSHLFNKWNWAYDNVARSRYLTRQRIAGNHTLPQDIDDWRYATAKSLYEHGKFACGLDLELVSGRTNEIICGMNTNGMNTSIFATFNATAAAQSVVDDTNVNDDTLGIWVEASTVDAWCEYDAFINISPGIATTVSF